MASLYVLGARQRKLLVKKEWEWNLYEAAVILQLDTETGAVRTCMEYRSPVEARPHAHSSMVFKSGTLIGDILYACTSTEVLIFKLPEFHRLGYISLPCFNDLHHVTPAADGSLLIANTGLDMVVKVTSQGDRLAEWSVLGEPAWSRFSPSTDYRQIESTKPHQSHPNFIFELNSEVWVTRLRQRDAVCLNDSGKRIDIAVQSPHDGLVRGEKVYFTTVDGRLVIASALSLQPENIIDLKEIDGQKSLLGWCRGLLPLDEDRIWVGFSRLRKTLFRENVLWVRSVFREGMEEKPTHITLYDIAGKRCLQEFDLERHGMNIVFSIFPVPAEKGTSSNGRC
jgi:hypothetical protein